MAEQFVDGLRKYLHAKAESRIPDAECGTEGEDPLWDLYKGLSDLESDRARLNLSCLKGALGDPTNASFDIGPESVRLLEREMDLLSRALNNPVVSCASLELTEIFEDRIDFLKNRYAQTIGGGNFFYNQICKKMPVEVLGYYEKWTRILDRMNPSEQELAETLENYACASTKFLEQFYGNPRIGPVVNMFGIVADDVVEYERPVLSEVRNPGPDLFIFSNGKYGQREVAAGQPFYTSEFGKYFVVHPKNKDAFESDLSHLLMALDLMNTRERGVIIDAFHPKKFVRGYEDLPSGVDSFLERSKEVYDVSFKVGSFDRDYLKQEFEIQ